MALSETASATKSLKEIQKQQRAEMSATYWSQWAMSALMRGQAKRKNRLMRNGKAK